LPRLLADAILQPTWGRNGFDGIEEAPWCTSGSRIPVNKSGTTTPANSNLALAA